MQRDQRFWDFPWDTLYYCECYSVVVVVVSGGFILAGSLDVSLKGFKTGSGGV